MFPNSSSFWQKPQLSQIKVSQNYLLIEQTGEAEEAEEAGEAGEAFEERGFLSYNTESGSTKKLRSQ
ncbi:MAG TPA: hypothetical protein VE944_06570 [Nostoc sp.]|uniref:hypothetical protein n=1 Tax=Nostoc sp. TaxID=1180 RepID=UPI002D3CCB5B|nr:hypothetical protein [Nostoc sp.]HYX14020.1 hypothetical protein [Nostoc sp.]